MSWFYRTFVRPVLFAQDAETIHGQMLHALGWVGRREIACDVLHSFYGAPSLPVRLFGLDFPNPVGLAAGMDKRAEAAPAWAAMGFGHIELGTVTRLAQPGNPLPRVFRVIPEEAVVNRMGFNNDGAEALAEALKQWRALKRWPKTPVGISLGKSKITPLNEAAGDYAASMRALRDQGDFFVVNVSSPNTPNLRQLQDRSALEEILSALVEARDATPCAGPPKPILVKVAPDLTFEALDEVLSLVQERGMAGVVATNTTLARPESSDPDVKLRYAETGGLSGKPLRARSTEFVRHIYRQSKGQIPVIGVGGVFTADDAWEKITAGASMVQVYTGLVFEGPGAVRDIVTGLQARLQEAGLKELSQAVGIASR